MNLNRVVQFLWFLAGYSLITAAFLSLLGVEGIAILFGFTICLCVIVKENQ